jgi:tRNA1(Val) A37 N6-methylase TrmN6
LDRREQRKIFSQLKKKKEEELKLRTIQKYPEIHEMFLEGKVTLKDAYNHCMSEILNVEGYKSKGTKGFVSSTKIQTSNEPKVKLPHTKNPLSDDLSINRTFDELNEMNFYEFRDYIFKVRESLKTVWVDDLIPPTSGKDLKEIIEDLNTLKSRDYSETIIPSNDKNYEFIIDCNYRDGSSCNQFFPQLYRVKTKNYSLWDLLNDKENELIWLRTMVRNLKCDYLYQFSKRMNNKSEIEQINLDEFGFLIQHSDTNSEITFTKEELIELRDIGILQNYHIENIESDFKLYKFFEIRYFKKGIRVFTKLIHTLRVSFNNQPTNFPPTVSKSIYEKFLPKKGRSVVYDPCSGFGGRMLGSMVSNRTVHYIGTDVNSSLFSPINSYQILGQFLVDNVGVKNTFSIDMISSDEMDKSEELNKHKGSVDLVFTSPPYYSKEMYSDDKEQSYLKYPNYRDWVEGYLYKTFEVVFKSLKPKGYCLINISDVNINSKELSLEIDTIRILEKIGFKYKYQFGMVMNRFIGLDTELLVNRWYDYNSEVYRKVEPILVFQK